jgi:small-conductance mechanosensitive channel
MQLENEARSDVSMLPDTPGALSREWRSFSSDGSVSGSFANFGRLILAALIALALERLVKWGLSRRLRRRLGTQTDGPSLAELLLLLLCDAIGVAVFVGTFVYSRHWLIDAGLPLSLILLAANALMRWRVASLVIGIVLRPEEPAARLIVFDDADARQLARFLSIALLFVNILIAFGRHGLADEDSGAHHIIGLLVAIAVSSLYALIVWRSRTAIEALLCGQSIGGLVGALRSGIARAWLAIGLTLVAGQFLLFVFGLSLGLLSYYQAALNTLATLLVLLVLERLTERGRQDPEPASGPVGMERLVGRSFRRFLRTVILLGAASVLAWIWIDAVEMSADESGRAVQSVIAAVGTLLTAYIVWEVTRLAIDRNLQTVSTGPKLPGSDDDAEAAPGSRLQTMLPMLRAAFGVVIAILAALIVLSRLGVDTAPLIAGAGVFGLALSFGSQSLVRDIISGVFYMWDDAFRVGEYIDTGRLKGTVESLGIRSVKLRHQNGPLHTIPYGQLGAVTNLSRDFATIKFNLRLEPGTDVELVRKTTKQLGLAMQEDNPELAAEVMLPLKLQGIAEVVDNAIVFRFKFTARPIKPTWVQREYLKRIYQVFAEKGITFASGALTLQTAPPRFGMPGGDNAGPPPQEGAVLEPANMAAARPTRVA